MGTVHNGDCNGGQSPFVGLKAYILAGGRGARLSPDKGFLTVGGAPIIERVRAAAAPLVDEVVLVGDPAPLQRLGLRVITEADEGGGPLAALCAALVDAEPDDALVLPWDAPFVSTAMLAFLRDQRGSVGAVVPRRGELIEPLCAVYGPECLEPAQEAFAAGRRRTVSFYEQIAVRWITEEELAPFGDWDRLFLNVNTAEDLERARRLADPEQEETR